MNPLRFAPLALAGLFAAPATADHARLPSLAGPVILTVSGLNSAHYTDGTLQFDLNRLEALGQSNIVTSSIWTSGPHVYTGVMLRTLTEFLRLDKSVLHLHALNDYSIDLPLDEASMKGPILATGMDGAELSVRQKGPIWVVYPYDSDAGFLTDEVLARSVWQLDRIHVQP